MLLQRDSTLFNIGAAMALVRLFNDHAVMALAIVRRKVGCLDNPTRRTCVQSILLQQENSNLAAGT